ncbi:MAG: N-acetylmuramoyl-L-alanine amidase [cyanobacterium endosymbiont of Rhopalodia musculus]|uniref:N-acetylmuramoyl-L-alanine amidase n=1 Tax=cyanobacterium endosymbiont of Epithemia clementina EcSB TaxID=3034674 RepID=UPI00247FEE06|nr:N-acetylmuramoyl-L-alanine amidase [cyanobacterium endosymbiont of Epithemia clementina EcSB]WGT67876.1 N-acetylmuramoyl-L-alanine amidase [cyanobacterium endosymbiont of Epithemia clementina EcSB]
MRFHWLLLSILSTLLFAIPAQAGRLLYWRFESNDNRLVFTTDSQVQPRAQLIPNPTRVVLDLPGIILERPSVNQAIGGTIKSVRIGQFNAQTTRLVIELAEGYTLDPQKVTVKGISPTQWSVDLPTPQRIARPSTSPSLPPGSTPAPLRPFSGPPVRTSNDFQVTRSGLFIKLERNGSNSQIQVNRSDDRKTIEFILPEASLPQSLLNQTKLVNKYGVGEIRFEQTRTSPPEARITMRVAKDSPNWQGYYSRLGGLVLLPKGGISRVRDLTSPEPSANNNPSNSVSQNPSNSVSQNQLPTISAIQLINNDTQLLIQSNKPIRGRGNLDRRTGVYTINIPNTQLAEPVVGPQLGKNSPIYELKVRQLNPESVEILVKPSPGIRFGKLTQPNQQVLALDVNSVQTLAISPEPKPLDILPPANASVPPINSYPTDSSSGAPKGRVLVIIDPGHGGKDPGAVGLRGLEEKNVILPISLDVSRLLQEQGVQVKLTRNADYFVSLRGRADLANRVGADIFVSIHANAVGGSRSHINGVEVFYYGHKDLSEAIHSSIVRSVNVDDRGVKKGRFYVLRKSGMPASLVEVGFVTGTEDNRKLSNPAYRLKMAQAIAQGILDYIRQKRL